MNVIIRNSKLGDFIEYTIVSAFITISFDFIQTSRAFCKKIGAGTHFQTFGAEKFLVTEFPKNLTSQVSKKS